MRSNQKRSSCRRSWLAATAICAHCLASGAAWAGPTQDEIFRSIEQNVSTSDQSGKVLAIVLCMAGALLLVAVISQRWNRPRSNKPINHPARLLKEVTRSLPLRPAEIKQLKILADASASLNTPVSSPLTLMLCPSLLAKIVPAKPSKLDRKVLAHLSRKLIQS